MPTPSRGHGTHVSRGGADWHLASREIEKDSRPVSGRRRPAERAGLCSVGCSAETAGLDPNPTRQRG